MSDIIIRATGEKAPLRFVLVSIKNAMNEIGKKHEAKGLPLKFMAETAAASLLLSSGLKFPGTVNFRAEAEGRVLAQADSTPQGLLRAMISQKDFNAVPSKIRVIKLNEKAERIKESIVEAPSMQMGVNLTAYLHQSEQTKSATGILAEVSEEDPSNLNFAMGFLLEAFPDAGTKELEIMDAVVRTLPDLKSFYKDGEYKILDLLDQLRGPYPVEIVKEIVPQAHCPCSRERVLASLSSLHPCEIRDLKQKNETLDVVCEYCRAHYAVTASEL
ncbi:MAG: Hsp33 family molecular chaperone HslO [Fibromonadales bacterium]|nr:Hsp33 family molecular chaperone HslO [Fibromonadales bacterium]